MIPAIIFFALAAFFNAVMDSIGDDVQYNQSVFSKLPYQFWNREQSWKYAKKIFCVNIKLLGYRIKSNGYHLDAWHISKSLMIICVSFAIYFGQKLSFSAYEVVQATGIIWVTVFNLFYSHIFKLKKQ